MEDLKMLEEFFNWIVEIEMHEWKENMERDLEDMANEADGISL